MSEFSLNKFTEMRVVISLNSSNVMLLEFEMVCVWMFFIYYY